MAAAEAKLSFDLAVDSVLDSLETKVYFHSFITTKKDVLALLPARISVALHTSSGYN